MKSFLLSLMALFSFSFLFSQNIGIGTATPTEKLDVNGNVRAHTVLAENVNATNIGAGSIYTGMLYVVGASEADFLKVEQTGQVGFRKGHGGIALRYIIARNGTLPSQIQTDPPQYNVTLVAEIKLWAGTFAPTGWMFCEGQLLPIAQHPELFQAIGTTYGGDGENTFALPDLRDRAPVGIDSFGGRWSQGETSD